MPRSKTTAKTTAKGSSKTEIELKYVGKNGEFIVGVPAADHTVTSQKEADRLVESGLYRAASGSAKATKADEPKAAEAKEAEKPDEADDADEKSDQDEGA